MPGRGLYKISLRLPEVKQLKNAAFRTKIEKTIK